MLSIKTKHICFIFPYVTVKAVTVITTFDRYHFYEVDFLIEIWRFCTLVIKLLDIEVHNFTQVFVWIKFVATWKPVPGLS